MLESDDKVVSQIMCECYRFIAEPDRLTVEQLDRMLQERCQPEHMAIMRSRFDCTVAEVNGKVCGIVALGGNNVAELFVHPAHHRHGIGAMLFRHAQERVKASDYTKLTVATTGYAIPFYEAMGMHTVGRRQVTFGPLEGRDLILLEKKLKAHDAEEADFR